MLGIDTGIDTGIGIGIGIGTDTGIGIHKEMGIGNHKVKGTDSCNKILYCSSHIHRDHTQFRSHYYIVSLQENRLRCMEELGMDMDKDKGMGRGMDILVVEGLHVRNLDI